MNVKKHGFLKIYASDDVMWAQWHYSITVQHYWLLFQSSLMNVKKHGFLKIYASDDVMWAQWHYSIRLQHYNIRHKPSSYKNPDKSYNIHIDKTNKATHTSEIVL